MRVQVSATRSAYCHGVCPAAVSSWKYSGAFIDQTRSATVPGGLLRLYDEVGVPAAAMRLPGEGEGRPMAEEIGRWNEIGPRFGLEVLGPPIPE